MAELGEEQRKLILPAKPEASEAEVRREQRNAIFEGTCKTSAEVVLSGEAMGEDNGTQRRSRWDRYRLSLPRLPRRLTFRDVQIIIVGLILSVIGGAIGWLIGQTR